MPYCQPGEQDYPPDKDYQPGGQDYHLVKSRTTKQVSRTSTLVGSVNLCGLKPSFSLVKLKYNVMFYLSVLNDVQGDTDINYNTAYSIYTKSLSCTCPVL